MGLFDVLQSQLNNGRGPDPASQKRAVAQPRPVRPVDAPIGEASRSTPTLTKGRITLPNGKERKLMFNPNDISDTKKVNWGSIEIPGASHPVYQFGSGGERLISFELYLDGDRGRANGFGRFSFESQSLSIADELAFYRSLVYPRQYGATFADVFPYTVFFTFGELYQRMPCIVKQADWKANFWTPKLEPVRATVSMVLGEIVLGSQTADQFVQGIIGTGVSGI